MEPLTLNNFYFLSDEGLEAPQGYLPGGYHPVHLGDVYCERYKVINKLGFGTYSTVWLARDIQSTIQTRYVALKFIVADSTCKSNENKIYRILASQPRTHPGSDHVLALLDYFEVHGPNGKHDVLVFKVMGPRLSTMCDYDSSPIRRAIKPLAHQIALGISFLHDCGVAHGDLHKGNIAFEIHDLDGKSEGDAMEAVGLPKTVPVLVRDGAHQTDSLPKYFVFSKNPVKGVKRDDLRIRIIDLGEAFVSTEAPQELHTPLRVRAPEGLFGNLPTPPKVEFGPAVDVWSLGCLIYELATSGPLMGWIPSDQSEALKQLTATLGSVPEEWVVSLGASHAFTYSASLEQTIQSRSKVDDSDAPGLIQLLQQILVLDPLRRPSASDLLNHPWFVGVSDVAILPGPAPESDSSSTEDDSDSSSSEGSNRKPPWEAVERVL